MLKLNRFWGIIIPFILQGELFAAVVLDKQELDLQQIVVTKSNIHLTRPYLLPGNKIEESGFDSPVEALSVSPLDLQSRSPKAGMQTDFSLRGSTFQGVLVLVNGQRINDPQTAHHNSDIPFTKEDIERIEVIPGASSSVFGPDSVGGAVNFITKKPLTRKGVCEFSYGGNRMSSEILSVTEKKDNLGMRFSLENQQSDGFRYDTDFKKFTTNFSSILALPSAEFGLDFGYQEKEFGAYDFYTPGKDYPSKEWTKTYLFNTGFTLEKSVLIKPNFLWRRHYDKFMLDKTQAKSRSTNYHRTDVFTPNIYFQKEIYPLGKLGLGFEYADELIKSTNIGKHTRNHKSVFLDDSKELLPDLSLGVSLRSDDYTSFGNSLTGSLSLRYKLTDNFGLNSGIFRSMRVPSFTELYYNDPTTVGDPGLKAEKSLNYQLGFDYKKEKVFYGATFFYRHEDGFIDWVKANSSQAKWLVENITQAGVFGIENNFKFNPASWFTIDANYTYINKRIDDQGRLYKYGPNYIRHLINTDLNFKLPFGVQTFSVAYKKRPVRRGWTLVTSKLTKNINKNTKVFLKITNLLNVEFQEIEGIAQSGRQAEVGIRFEW